MNDANSRRVGKGAGQVFGSLHATIRSAVPTRETPPRDPVGAIATPGQENGNPRGHGARNQVWAACVYSPARAFAHPTEPFTPLPARAGRCRKNRATAKAHRRPGATPPARARAGRP